MCPKRQYNFKCMYSRSAVKWYLHNWRGATVLHLSNRTCYLRSQRKFFPCVSTVGSQQSNLVCCHNDTVACSTSRFPNYFQHHQTCSYLVSCCASNCVFTYIGIFGSHYDSSVGSVKYRLQNVKSQNQYVYWKVLTTELLELGAIFFKY